MFTAAEVRLLITFAYKHGQRHNKAALRKLFAATFEKGGAR
jgi:hypothetical protein